MTEEKEVKVMAEGKVKVKEPVKDHEKETTIRPMKNTLKEPVKAPSHDLDHEPSKAPEPEPRPPSHPCPYADCDAGFDSFKQLQGHFLGKHKESLSKTDYDNWRREVGILPTEAVKAPSREARPFEPGERAHPPDDLEELEEQLIKFRVTAKNASAVVEYMKPYSVDDLPRLNRALQSVGMARARKVMFMESWIESRGIQVDEELAQDLGLWISDRRYRQPESYERSRYGQYDRREVEKDEVARKIDAQLDEARKLAMLRALYGPDEEDSGQVRALAAQVQRLAEQLEQERRARTADTVKRLEEKIDKLENSQGDALNLGITRLADIGDKYVTFLATGAMVGEEPPKRARGKPSSVADILRDFDGGAYLEVE